MCRGRTRLAVEFAATGSLELCARLRRKSRFQPYLAERRVAGTERSDGRRAAGNAERDDALRESGKLLLIQQPGRRDPRVCDRQWRNRKSQLCHARDKSIGPLNAGGAAHRDEQQGFAVQQSDDAPENGARERDARQNQPGFRLWDRNPLVEMELRLADLLVRGAARG